jgi:hypothetical protein
MTVTLTKGTDEIVDGYVDDVVTGYLAAALWTGYHYPTEESFSSMTEMDHLDSLFTVDELSPSVVAAAREDVESFVRSNWGLLWDLDPEQVGHDFLLTRNGHGAGFWDRGLGARGDILSEACEPYGTADLVSYGVDRRDVANLPTWTA